MPFKLSPSSIALFQECSRCFWLDKHKVWKRPSKHVIGLLQERRILWG